MLILINKKQAKIYHKLFMQADLPMHCFATIDQSDSIASAMPMKTLDNNDYALTIHSTHNIPQAYVSASECLQPETKGKPPERKFALRSGEL